jgi:DNA-binding LacI/PurR family transcriptional regulator
MAARPARVTSSDVAKAAGFSRQLVGFVLNNTPGQSIPEATRAKVLQAAEQLGYVPHGPAQALRRGRGRTVLLALPDLPQSPTVGDLVASLADALAAQGFTLVTYLLGADHRSPRDVAAALAPVAVLGLTAFTDAEVATFTASGAAVVIPRPGTEAASSLDDSGQLIGAMQVEHLAARGHRHIAYAVPDDARAAVLAPGRYEGARQAAARLGLPPLARGVLAGTARDAVQAWRSRRTPVTAVACFNDDLAFAVLAAAHQAGLRIPGELAVIGAEDIPAARFAQPALTTVSFAGKEAGAGLAQLLIDLLAERDAPFPDSRELFRISARHST